jgi:hypothetical protein
MNRDKVLALAAYAFQAVATLGLVFGLGHVLSAAHYGPYSLAVATAQTASVLAFEWIRLAAVRFCSGVEGEEARRRLATIQTAFVCLAALAALVTLGLWAWGPSSDFTLISGLFIALLSAATDLHLVFLRASGSFQRFAGLQCSRAALLFGTTMLMAAWTGSAQGALGGMALGYGLATLNFMRVDAGWWRWRPGRVDGALLGDMARYGLMASAASTLYMQVPLLLRWTGEHRLGAAPFAALSLAMDILQKPMAMVTSAIGGILTPAVIAQFEQSPDARSKPLGRLYEAQIWAVVLMGGGILAFMPELCAWMVKPAWRADVLAFTPAILVTFAAHTLLQTTVSIAGHLLKLGTRLIAHALLELAMVGLALALGTLAWPGHWMTLVAVSATLAMLAGLPLMRRVPSHLPKASLMAVTVCSGLLAQGWWWPTAADWPATVTKGTAALALLVGLVFLRRKLPS